MAHKKKIDTRQVFRVKDLHVSLNLTPDEAAVLRDIQSPKFTIGRGHDLINEGRRCPSIYLLTEGLAIRYRVLRDGQRQVIHVLLPGDFAGIPSCFFPTALYSVRAITLAVVAPIKIARFNSLMETY